MEILHCSFCQHGNPVDAKFCNACGASLELQLCECGAIDKVSATNCHKCGKPFPPRLPVTVADDGAAPAATGDDRAAPSARPSRAHWKAFVLLALLAAGGLLLYPRTTADHERATRTRLPPAPATADAGIASPPPAAPVEPAQESEAPPPAVPPQGEPQTRSTPAGDEAAASASPASPLQTEAQPAALPAEPVANTAVPEAAPQEPAATAADPAPAAAPADCSPVIDALGLCNTGFR